MLSSISESRVLTLTIPDGSSTARVSACSALQTVDHLSGCDDLIVLVVECLGAADGDEDEGRRNLAPAKGRAATLRFFLSS